MQLRYSLCPNCDACPEVAISGEAVVIGEEGNRVKLSAEEWNVLVAAIKAGELDAVACGSGERAAGKAAGCCEA